MSTAGILIIGNEILSGKVQDENAPYLLRELRVQGVDVLRVLTIPDEVDLIASEVRALSGLFDYVLTSGGVGPTHDDVTMEGVAKGLGRRLLRDERMRALLENALRGRETNESHLKMTELPEGSELIETPDLWFPLVQVENVFVFPGIPGLLRAKFEGSRERFEGSPVFLRHVYVTSMETDVALDLQHLLDAFPELMLGSYPQVGQDGYRTLLTLESRDESYLNRAVDALLARIPEDYVLRVE